MEIFDFMSVLYNRGSNLTDCEYTDDTTCCKPPLLLLLWGAFYPWSEV